MDRSDIPATGLHINCTHPHLGGYQRPASFNVPNIMSFANFDTVPPRTSLPSRVALALAHATVASYTYPQIVPFGSTGQESTQMVVDYVDNLRKESKNWTTLTGDSFPKTLAKGTAALNGFRHYMVQDALYLENYYWVRLEAVKRTGSFKELTDFAAKLSQSLQYVADAKSDLTYKLGIPEDDVKNEKPSDELIKSVNFYHNVATTGDWLDMNIAFLPCIMGYYDIASKLLLDPGTVRNTVYFPLWVQAMAGVSTVSKYKEFINGHIVTLFAKLTPAQQKAKWADWLKMVDEACTHETDFFRLGGSPLKSYEIVSGKEYNIRSYLEGKLYLVNGGSSVTAKTIDPKDASAKWTLTNSPDGYTIKNGTKFLGVSPGSQEVGVLDKGQYWSINSGGGLEKVYQFLNPDGLQWVVDIESPPKVVVANNSQISSQFWLIDPAPA
ncbi:hypothetical protein J3R82DRAFT_7287 [Butyriboletus roseoflavus]|nr:hypothetical protein J3R82DRAFT_7287 [Butyriboletus roseoflavus]